MAVGHNSEFMKSLRSEMRCRRVLMYSRHFSNEGCCSSGSLSSCLRFGSANSADTWATVSGIADTARTWKVCDGVMNDELAEAGASNQSEFFDVEDVGPVVDQ